MAVGSTSKDGVESTETRLFGAGEFDPDAPGRLAPRRAPATFPGLLTPEWAESAAGAGSFSSLAPRAW